MNKINIGLIGYGVVGQGVVKILSAKRTLFKEKYNTEFNITILADRSVTKKDTSLLKKAKLTTDINDILKEDNLDVVIELIGGMNPAKDIVTKALAKGLHVITANKVLIANAGKELFAIAQKNNAHLYFESSVGAGIPVIKTITEGIAGNTFNSLYGIINGTCNFILSEMTTNNLSFEAALKLAQEKGYAESDPTLDVNGMDTTHKLAILVYLAFGKTIPVKEIYTEGITHISHDDIEYAESLGLAIKLLAIAKSDKGKVEARVHPTLIPKEHPLSNINDIYNAIYLNSDLMGDLLLSGEGAGQMAAASGVVSDLIDFSSQGYDARPLCNIINNEKDLSVRSINNIETKFYLRFNAPDKPGILSKITGILGQAEIGINSVTQKAHNKTATVPVIMLTDYTTEAKLRSALDKIYKAKIVKTKPVAIRMERLP